MSHNKSETSFSNADAIFKFISKVRFCVPLSRRQMVGHWVPRLLANSAWKMPCSSLSSTSCDMIFVVVVIRLYTHLYNLTLTYMITLYKRKEIIIFVIRKIHHIYISYYCLFCHPYSSWEHGTKFKYILCYCLSQSLGKFDEYYADSNTSHVIVYPDGAVKAQSQSDNSNTSHVIVYQARL